MKDQNKKSRRHFIRTAAVAATVVPGLCAVPGAGATAFFLELTGWQAAFDIVVYGATPAGITAAVAAAREGRSVALIEPLAIAGGMMSGGLAFSDSNQMFRSMLGGLFEEFHQRVEKVYADRGIVLNYRVQEKDTRHWTYEPHVAELVFNGLLKEAGVQVFLNETLTTVTTRRKAIEQLKTTSGKSYKGTVFIDASYEGDLMAAAKVSYRVGRESREEFGESLAGAAYPKQAVAAMALNAQQKPLPLISGTTLPAAGAGDHRIMTYSFRLCLSEDPANSVPFTAPEGYDADRYELFRRYYRIAPESGIPLDLYPIPGNKLDGNNGIGRQLSSGLVGENWDYPDAGPQRRKEIWKQHVTYTQGLLYFLMTDPAVPEAVRMRMKKMGYAKDEFALYDHFPPVLYVREARRMEGAYFLTQKDILENKEKPDPIGVGSFPIDSHDCQRIATPGGGFINEGTIFPAETRVGARGIAYQIPYRCMLPKAEECTNLLVPVCASSSHVAFSSLRVEPAWMVMGESAGIAAAVAVENRVTVQKVDTTQLATRLKAKGQVLHF
ncbi:FAD-dependent oxidoreductase [Niabella beijingensis]|uniref:FAD-dependent oxidoreductase n=1 Tax=Niabella beijingensis TaxID=2872700 RepID=UPI001CC13C58|nr:FAD-dependent oxidoreductase [Niabella beijingensis]MBZ4189438.1 FAD-dependent oxidoreductase [Niabella beijingensis]